MHTNTHLQTHKHRHLFLNKPPGRGRLARSAQQSGRWRQERAGAPVAKASAWCFPPQGGGAFLPLSNSHKVGGGGGHRGANGDGKIQ